MNSVVRPVAGDGAIHGALPNLAVVTQQTGDESAEFAAFCASNDLRLAASVPTAEKGGPAATLRHSPQEKIQEAYEEVLAKAFHPANGKAHFSYRYELRAAAKEDGLTGAQLLRKGGQELREHAHRLRLDELGRPQNAEEVGKYFARLCQVLGQNLDLFVLHSPAQLSSTRLPFSESYKQELRKILDKGEIVMMWLAKSPPKEAAREIKHLSEERLHGVLSVWTDARLQGSALLSPKLKDYLAHATVRIMCTGHYPEVNAAVKRLNQELERNGGFEDRHWLRMVKSVTLNEKHESLTKALSVCVPIIAAVKVLEHFVPGAMHAVSGFLDDLFGAIIPSVSQSMGRADRPLWERLKKAWPVLQSGLLTLPVAAGLGWGSAVLYGSQYGGSPLVKVAAGLMFALACCGGTLGTSIGAVKEAFKQITKLQHDPEVGYLLKDLAPLQKWKLAFHEAITNIPFRIGHTLMGVPMQLGLGVAAALGGFFHNSWFVIFEGAGETLLGAAVAFAYPLVVRALNTARLRREQIDSK